MLGIVLSLFPSAHTHAENALHWTTNHYYVTGGSVREIRHSMNHARPGGTGGKTDGATVWNISWTFKLHPSDSGCRITSFKTKTVIALTMPAWTAPSNAEDETKKSWARYYLALLRHEVGHARIAQNAEAEIRKRVARISTTGKCSTLRKQVDAVARDVIREFRQRDIEYDRRTRHGAKDGAHFP